MITKEKKTFRGEVEIKQYAYNEINNADPESVAGNLLSSLKQMMAEEFKITPEQVRRWEFHVRLELKDNA